MSSASGLTFADHTSGQLLIAKPKACIPCRTRKVKCNKTSPCENCAKWSIQCLYPSARRTCRRPSKKAQPAAAAWGNGGIGTSGALDEQLHHVLGLAKELPSTSSTASEAGAGSIETLVSRVTNDLSELQKLLATQNNPAAASLLQNGLQGLCNPALPGLSPQQIRPQPMETFNADVASLHPSEDGMWELLTAYNDMIDPLVKIIHKGTLTSLFEEALGNPKGMQSCDLALLLAVYFAAVSSMADSQVQKICGLSKASAMTTYRFATEHALVKADLFNTANLTTLQAFVLLLSVGGFVDDNRRTWALTSLADQLSYMPLPPSSYFEAEMRLRLLWRLWYIDHRAQHDLGKASVMQHNMDMFELPTNIKDQDLKPMMRQAPTHREGWTEASFSILQLEVARTARKLDTTRGDQAKEDMISACERHVEGAYIQYCDGSVPIHWLARHVADVLIMELRFAQYMESYGNFVIGDLPTIPSCPDDLFLSAIDILDIERRVGTEPEAKRWTWLLGAYKQFAPLCFVLSELCYRQDSPETDRAWRVALIAYEKWKYLDDRAHHCDIVRSLFVRAESTRTALCMGAIPLIECFQ